MSKSALEGLRGRLALLGALACLTVGLAVSPASADAFQISIEPTTLSVTEDMPTTVGVTGTGFLGQNPEDLEAGICTVRGIGMFGVPACGQLTGVSIVGDDLESAVLAESVEEGQAIFANAHYLKVPGHGPTFDCLEEQEEFEGCEVVIVDHSGMTPSILASASLAFTP